MKVALLSADIAKVDRMAQSGSSLLRLIQNDELPILDLLVRESLQNSLDAGKKNTSHVNVDLAINKFKKENVLNYFEGLTDTIGNFFLESEQKSLIIRDANTEGLTGPLSYEDMESREEQGNLLNLVYEIGRPQEKEGAGGSWGLGKTVYFRVGIGLVIYYSRVLNNNGDYSSRLAACLIEDETKDENKTFIPYGSEHKLKRGVAWWGEQRNGKSVPITDEGSINEILEEFNVEPYKDEATGTTIILPFIKENELLTEKSNGNSLPWTFSLERYLTVAVQRWYAPRLNNELFPYGGRLECTVNDRTIKKVNMEPPFLLMQDLYNQALDQANDVSILQDAEAYVESINTKNVLSDSEAGRISFAIVDKNKMLMAPPNNLPSPYEYFDVINHGGTENAPIISHTRKPGMIVSYNTAGEWVDKVQPQNENHFLIGLFVPNSDNEIINSHFKEHAPTVEAYLRKSEKADHRSWYDYLYLGKGLNLVNRVQKTLTKRINKIIIKEDTIGETKRDTQLSNIVGKALLPPRGYGKSPGKEGTGKPRGGGKPVRKRNFSYELLNIKAHSVYKTEITFSVKPLNNKSVNANLEISALSEQGIMRGDKWENDIDVHFPFTLKNVVLDENLELKPVKTKKFGRDYSGTIDIPEGFEEVRGTMLIENEDPLIQMHISVNDYTNAESKNDE